MCRFVYGTWNRNTLIWKIFIYLGSSISCATGWNPMGRYCVKASTTRQLLVDAFVTCPLLLPYASLAAPITQQDRDLLMAQFGSNSG